MDFLKLFIAQFLALARSLVSAASGMSPLSLRNQAAL